MNHHFRKLALVGIATLFSVTSYSQIFDAAEVGKVKASGRVNMDGALFFSDPNNFKLSDGATFSELRLRFASALTTRMDVRAEVDFAFGNIVPRDVALRYYVNKDFTLTLGNFREPFSYGAYCSSVESFFISTSTPAQAFGSSRNLGFAARYVKPSFFLEAGFFTQDLLDQVKGSKGYAFTNRVLYRPINDGSNVLHFGFSNSIRRADANNFGTDEKGNQIELRTINYGSRVETNVDRQQVISVKNPYAKYQDKLSVELLGIWNRFAVQGEYINTFVQAKSGYDNQRYCGYYAQAMCQLKGNGIAYNSNDALASKATVGSINLAVRYSYTSLNDAKGYLVKGVYTDTPLGGVANGSFNGGTTRGVAAALSYAPLKNIIFSMEYNWGKVESDIIEKSSFNFAQLQAIVQF